MGMTLAPTVAPAGESAPSAQLPCPCALPEGSYDVTATNLAGMQVLTAIAAVLYVFTTINLVVALVSAVCNRICATLKLAKLVSDTLLCCRINS